MNFTIPRWRQDLLVHQERLKNQILHAVLKDFDVAFSKAIDQVIEHYRKTGRYTDPLLNSLDAAGEDFYRSILTHAFWDAQMQEKEMCGYRRLARLPKGMPRKLRSLEQIFRHPLYWPVIMKRNKKLTDQIRKTYLQKLRRKFKDLVPRMLDGTITPQDAKEKMMADWKATKPRVETIFRNETTTYFAETQVRYFKSDPEIIGFLFDSTKDSARTEICKSRHGLIFRKDHTGLLSIAANTPACHHGCRSGWIALANTAENRKLVSDPRRDPANRTLAPLPPGWRKSG